MWRVLPIDIAVSWHRAMLRHLGLLNHPPQPVSSCHLLLAPCHLTPCMCTDPLLQKGVQQHVGADEGVIHLSYVYDSLCSCLPIFTPEVASALTAYKKSHPNDTRTEDPLLQPISGWDIGIFLADVIHGWELITFSGSLALLLFLAVREDVPHHCLRQNCKIDRWN